MRNCQYCHRPIGDNAGICVRCVPNAISNLCWWLDKFVGGRWEEIPTGGGCSAVSSQCLVGVGWGRVFIASDALAPVPYMDTYATAWIEDSRGSRTAETEIDNMGSFLTNNHIQNAVSILLAHNDAEARHHAG